MSQQARIDSLKIRHANLDSRIVEEDHRPQPDQDALNRLKLEKLRVKQEMERLRDGL
ncbi:YdcH family protein [Lichenicoccus sp.]|uniref:YdcH family protein n=1 Tax=Lichenicoccus sp. TaxID=2781899 RepID=UPI003D10168E